MDRGAVSTKAQLRWEPDRNAVAAVLAVPKSFVPMTDMNDMDRAWLVAGLTLAGLTAEDIAERTSCSRRLVMTIRAHPATMVAAAAREENVELERDLCAERSQHANTRRELADAERERDRIRQQFDDLLDAMITEGRVRLCAKQLHPMVKYNTYRYTDRSGTTPRVREICRQCSQERVNRCRAKQKAEAADQASNAEALHGGDLGFGS